MTTPNESDVKAAEKHAAPLKYIGDRKISEMDFLAGAAHVRAETEAELSRLRRELAEAVEILKWYGCGGNFQTDIWHHPDLGYFTGKRARDFLNKLTQAPQGEQGEM
jgi:hypothetical protein